MTIEHDITEAVIQSGVYRPGYQVGQPGYVLCISDPAEVAKGILDMLKRSGILSIKAPKPLYGPDGAGGYGFPEGVSTQYGDVWLEDHQMDPDDAEALAGALLAAVEVA